MEHSSDTQPVSVRGILSCGLYPMRFIEFAWLSERALVASLGLVYRPTEFEMHCYHLEYSRSMSNSSSEDLDLDTLPPVVVEYQQGTQFIPCHSCARLGLSLHFRHRIMSKTPEVQECPLETSSLFRPRK